ncbi:MAG TPA: PQQ-binding-like beta-propeller repeat protein [Acidimicrobiales bacterium]
MAVLGIVAAVLATRDDGGDGGGGGGGRGNGWADARSNPQRMATDGEIVCASGLTVDFYCLDAATGDDLWEVDFDESPSSSPTIVDDMVLIGGHGLKAYTLDGEEVWSHAMKVSNHELPPLHLPVVGDVVAAIDEAPIEHVLVGVDVATGEERWERFRRPGEGEPEISSFSDVLSDGERFYVTTETRPEYEPGEPAPMGPTLTLVAIDPEDGEDVWQYEIATDSLGFPVATEVALLPDAGAAAFIVQSGGSSGRVVVLDTATGEERWEADLQEPDSSVVHVDGVTVVADGTALRGYDDDGAELWSSSIPDDLGLGQGSLAVREGRVFVSAYDVYEVDPATGEVTEIRAGVSADDVQIAGDLLLIAGISGIEAVPLPPR